MHYKIIKIGGNVVDNPELLEQFITDFASVEDPKILVHGGGVMASQMQKALGQQPMMIEGRRVTDEATLKVVTMVYAGWCSKSIVALMQKHGCNAIGLCGADANIIQATKRPPVIIPMTESVAEAMAKSEGGTGPGKGTAHEWNISKDNSSNNVAKVIDYGFVGDVDPSMINSGFLLGLVRQGITPVICAITHDKAGNLLNTNADTIASSVAVSISMSLKKDMGRCCTGLHDKVSLTYCFEKDGVLYDKDDDSSLIAEITPESYASLKAEGKVAAGMVPKLDNSFKALEAGVDEVIVKHARNLSKDKGTRLHYLDCK
ncbi:MAG: acetylglutamate kinase [Bacteroidales bacterium]|nr:acetylglutamate kinase [Bacteroidales bacterium]